jgi:hypothetical protein
MKPPEVDDYQEQFDRYLKQAKDGQSPPLCAGLDGEVLGALAAVSESATEANINEAKAQFAQQMDGTHSKQHHDMVLELIQQAMRDNAP